MSWRCSILVEAARVGPRIEELSAGQVAYLSFCHPGRALNQDALALLDRGDGRAVLAIADGMGGHRDGEKAARLAIESLAEKVMHSGEGLESLEDVIRQGFLAGHRRIAALGTDAGTTLVAVEVSESSLQSTHCGDSFAAVVGRQGHLKSRTLDHSPTAYACDAGVLAEQEALTHPDRHLILTALGHEGLRLDVGPRIVLARSDTVLLASDGLSDNLLSEEYLNLARRGSLEEAAQGLLQRTQATMGKERAAIAKPDDLSLILFRPRRAE